MHTLLLPPVQNTTNGNLFILLPDIINCLMDHSRSGKWLSYNFLHLIDISSFSHCLCIFILDCSLPLKMSYCLLWLTSFQKRLSLPYPHLNFIVIKKPILLARCFDKSLLFGCFHRFYCTFCSQVFGLVEHTSGIIKSQLAKLVKTL